MKRLLAILVLIAAAGAIVVLGSGAGNSSGDGYRVRAEFRNAFSVIPGEDVKIAGVKVGKIKSLDVTPAQTAAVVLDITKPGFDDFRSDAECTIRPQSLIGEKYVECTPTQPRAEGAPAAPPLKKVTSGAGQGEYFLPVANTSRPVDLDLVNNTLRLPYRERLTILLNEFGAGLGGRGQDLRSIIHNADPALKQTDKVLKILGDQNQVLADLARNSDTVLAPLGRERAKVADFVEQANTTAKATAEKRGALELNLVKLPAFLGQLKPTMERLGHLADQATPVLADLGRVAPDVNTFVRQLGPFSQAATPAVRTLGDASVVGRQALVASRPIVQDLKGFAQTGKPLSKDLNELLTSFRDTGGIERAMDYIFYQMAAVNGFDQFGHYLRAQLVLNLCSTYATKPDPSCTANFVKSGTTQRSAHAALAAKNHGRSPALARADAVLRGLSVAHALGRKHKKKGDGKAASPLRLPSQLLPGQAPAPAPSAPAPAQPGPAAPAAPQAPAPAPGAPQQSPNPVKPLLDYLLGGGG